MFERAEVSAGLFTFAYVYSHQSQGRGRRTIGGKKVPILEMEVNLIYIRDSSSIK